MTYTKSETRFAGKSDYNDVRGLWDKTFEEDSIAWRDWYFEYIYKEENCLISKQGGKLVSMAHINPYPMMLNSKEIASAALAGIATEEDERGKGYAAHLIKESLREMHKRGISFSFLYPFNYDFYRKYGYELCYENNIYTVQSKENTSIVFQPADETAQASEIYAEYTKELNGYIIRSAAYQKIKLLEHLADGNNAYIIMEHGRAAGYVLAEERKEKTVLGELMCGNPAKAAGALSAHLNMTVEFSSPYTYEGLTPATKPHCMGRIVDVAEVFDGISAKSGTMVIRIADDIIDQNCGNFLFQATDGMLSVSRTDMKEDVSVGIIELAQVATGLTGAMSEKAREIYSVFFEEKTPWISEVC